MNIELKYYAKKVQDLTKSARRYHQLLTLSRLDLTEKNKKENLIKAEQAHIVYTQEIIGVEKLTKQILYKK